MRVRIGPYRKNRAEKIEIESFDTWSMDHTLALIIHPMLIQLKATKHGAPVVDWEDVPEELRPPKDQISKLYTHGETDDNFFKRWDWVMDEMIWSFNEKNKSTWKEEFYGPYIESKDDDSFGHFEWIDHEGMKVYQARMSNGFRLFGKYYENLWD